MKRPAKWPGAITGSFFVLVNTEPVRSAEPPIVFGISALMTSSVSSDDLRVARAGFSATNLSFNAAIAGASEAGASPESAASKGFRIGLAETRASQDLRAPPP